MHLQNFDLKDFKEDFSTTIKVFNRYNQRSQWISRIRASRPVGEVLYRDASAICRLKTNKTTFQLDLGGIPVGSRLKTINIYCTNESIRHTKCGE